MNESEKNRAERDESRMVKGFLVLLGAPAGSALEDGLSSG